ncbi:MAG: hypothetical protein IJ408_02340 [Clostridia bacterium]|nr:hypothetical protein [Clostridia bacterium]
MRKFSKILAIILIIVMLMSLAVSCKKNPDDIDEQGVQGGESAGTENSTKDPDGQQGATSGNNSGVTNSGTNGGSDGKKPGTNSGTSGGATTNIEDGKVTENEHGTVTNTNTDLTVDESFHINEAVTNDNGFIPDDEQGQEKSERRATEASKYDFDKNPLINRDRQNNKKAMPSFEIDDTGFVADGTKLKDLRGKTLIFYTGDDFAAWSYRNEKGETIDEWDWFKMLKKEIGLNIKTYISSHYKSAEDALKAMNAGKQADVVYSSHVIYPAALCISRSITDLISINNIGSSPGVCKTTMDICKWGNTYRVIAPIGEVDVLWYNATLSQELGLADPHMMWEADKWDWNAFKSYMLSAPQKTKNGDTLVSITQWPANTAYIWPCTNDSPRIYIDANASVPTLINNWDAPETMEALEFICEIHNTTNFGTNGGAAYRGLFLGTTLMSATMYTQVYYDTEYSKHVQINWVPYPKKTAKTLSVKQAELDKKFAGSSVKPAASHDGIAQFSGFAMLLPKKTAKPANVGPALKFMELWATRFTEALFDNLNVFEYYNFNYKQRKQYFDFVTQNVVFSLAMGDFMGCDLRSSNYFAAMSGNPQYNIKTEATKNSNIVQNYIVDCLKFGQ